MKIESEKDFPILRQHINNWKKRFPMFCDDVNQIEKIVEHHIQNYSIELVYYRQTKKINFLENAQKEIDAINRIILTVEKIELLSLLHR